MQSGRREGDRAGGDVMPSVAVCVTRCANTVVIYG